MKHVST